MPETPSVVTPGNHDGVHLGHRALIDAAKRIADARNWRTVGMFFNPHTTAVLAPERACAMHAEGRTIAEPLEAAGVFPGMVVQMIAVGESTGAMDAMLTKIADFYDEEVDAAVEALTSLMEPFMMVFLGGTIGAILMAMYLPIFKIAENIK